jgi:hypothetical protein
MAALRRAGIVSTTLLVAAWSSVALVPYILRSVWNSASLAPFLPSVAVPWVADSDIISSVPYLFRAVALGLVAVALVEVAKAVVLDSAEGTRLSTHFAAAALQFLLLIDALRIHAYDWFLYLANILEIVELRSDRLVGDATAWRSPVPWMSLPLLLVTLGLVVRLALVAPPGTASNRRRRP